MTESALICAAGGLLGIFLSVLATRLLAHAWKDLPTAQGIYIDGPVIAFACMLMFAGALVAGLLPALSTTGKTMLVTQQTSPRTGASSASRTALRKMPDEEEERLALSLVFAGVSLRREGTIRRLDIGKSSKIGGPRKQGVSRILRYSPDITQ